MQLSASQMGDMGHHRGADLRRERMRMAEAWSSFATRRRGVTCCAGIAPVVDHGVFKLLENVILVRRPRTG